MPKTNKNTGQTAAAEQAEEIVQSADTEQAASADSTEQTASTLTNAQIDNEARSMKAILDARPKVRVKLIDRAAAESGATPPPHPVGINGYVFYIPWNEPVEVPDRVAAILEQQGLI